MTVPFRPVSGESVPFCPDLGGTGLARVRNRDSVPCPVPSRSLGVPCPASDALPTLTHSQKLSENKKRRIESDARMAAIFDLARTDACPWMYASQEGQHWLAVYLLNGGKKP